jgi:hypothetical protein
MRPHAEAGQPAHNPVWARQALAATDNSATDSHNGYDMRLTSSSTLRGTCGHGPEALILFHKEDQD